MIKVITAVALTATMAMAEVIAVDPNSNLGQAISNGSVSGATLIPTPTNGVDGIDGVDGVDGTNGDTSYLFKEQERFESGMVALSSVELNPDHEGWSVGFGGQFEGTNAGAIGVMYSEKFEPTDTIQTIGYNIKAYDAEGSGGNGFGVGITLGF